MLSIKVEQHFNIKFLIKLEKSAIGTSILLTELYGNQYLSCVQVFEWFKDGREDL